MQDIFPIFGCVQHYAWGGFSYIPSLLDTVNAEQRPFAEYWLGAHPLQPSRLHGENANTTLADLLSGSAGKLLGKPVASQFGELPFLLKVLDVRKMLSIQVHPNKEQAIKGFEEEEERGIPRSAPDRNYKDRNHKPEIMMALSDFYLLHGFRPEAELEQLLENIPGFSSLHPHFKKGHYKGLYEHVMQMPASEADHILRIVGKLITPLYQEGKLKKEDPHFWAARAMETFGKDGHYDRGIFSIYFFNLLHLSPGQGIFQDAGLPHAYLEGQNVELMANSDNVLRAGLTDKHIDVPELLKLVRFEATHPKIIEAPTGADALYAAPVAEFELWRHQLFAGRRKEQQEEGPAILLVLEGSADMRSGDQLIHLSKGGSVFVAAGTQYQWHSAEGALLVRATVPGV